MISHHTFPLSHEFSDLGSEFSTESVASQQNFQAERRFAIARLVLLVLTPLVTSYLHQVPPHLAGDSSQTVSNFLLPPPAIDYQGFEL